MVETQQLIWNANFNRWDQQLISTLNTSPILNQSLYVSKTGSDDTGNGSSNSPFLTIAYALSFISNAGAFVRYAIHVAPGEYEEPFQIKPWIAIIGSYAGSNGVSPNGAMLVEITAPADSCSFDASFENSGYAVSFMSGLGFQNHQTFNELSGMEAQLNFASCAFDDGVSFLAPGTAGVDNIMLDDCLLYNGITVQGFSFLWTRNCTFLGGTVNVKAGLLGASQDTNWLSQGSSIGASLSPTNINIMHDGYDGYHFARADINNSDVVGNLVLDGYLTSYNATMGGIPCNVSLLNGADAPVSMSCLSQSAPPVSSGSGDYSLFFCLAPGDNSATVGLGVAVQFPQDGPSTGVILRELGNTSSFILPVIGDYEVSFQVSINEPGQLQLDLNSLPLPNTVVGRATGTSQLVCHTIISTTVANSILRVINPPENSTALTLTPIAGGTIAVSGTLLIKAL